MVWKISSERWACSGLLAATCAEWTREDTGASELLSSWEMTRMTFFQI